MATTWLKPDVRKSSLTSRDTTSRRPMAIAVARPGLRLGQDPVDQVVGSAAEALERGERRSVGARADPSTAPCPCSRCRCAPGSRRSHRPPAAPRVGRRTRSRPPARPAGSAAARRRPLRRAPVAAARPRPVCCPPSGVPTDSTTPACRVVSAPASPLDATGGAASKATPTTARAQDQGRADGQCRNRHAGRRWRDPGRDRNSDCQPGRGEHATAHPRG